MPRLFVALPLADEVVDAIAAFVRDVAGPGDGVKWAPAENLHVTLKFLGEQPGGRVDDLVDALRRAVDGVPPFRFSVGGLGAFPDLRRPRVLWVGIGLGEREVVALAARIERETARARFPLELRPFSAHVTVGRPRGFERKPSRRGRQPAPIAERVRRAFTREEGLGFGTCAAGEVQVLRSDPGEGRSVYTVLERIPLQAGAAP